MIEDKWREKFDKFGEWSGDTLPFHVNEDEWRHSRILAKMNEEEWRDEATAHLCSQSKVHNTYCNLQPWSMYCQSRRQVCIFAT